MWEAYKLVRKNGGSAGIDKQTLEKFEAQQANNLYKLWNRMSSGSYIPQAVKRVNIPKKDGGKRPLGIPTIADRIAQMIARLALEPVLEPIFHEDSYGYRPCKSAHKALARCRERCWKYDWVIDLDIKGFFDTIEHGMMMKAVEHNHPPKWVRLYIDRWLKAPVQEETGEIAERTMGTPQGGVVSPLLANLFLHYAFDAWMAKNHRGNPFERYADDIVIHCRTKEEAERVLADIKQRLTECKLTVHPAKTKIVYCRDSQRKSDYKHTEFEFLGYTFKPRIARSKDGRYFLGFSPAISKKSEENIKDTIRSWKLHKYVRADLQEISKEYNSTLRGWMNYYGRYRPSAMYGIFSMFQRILVKWAKNKFKKLKGSWLKAVEFLKRNASNSKNLFAHWESGWYING